MNAWDFCEEFFKAALDKVSAVFVIRPADHLIQPIKSKWTGEFFVPREELMRSLPIKSRWAPSDLVERLFRYLDASGFGVQGRLKPGELNIKGAQEFFAAQTYNALLFLLAKGIPDGPYTDFIQDLMTVEDILGRRESASGDKEEELAVSEEELIKKLSRSLIDPLALLKQLNKPSAPQSSTGQYL